VLYINCCIISFSAGWRVCCCTCSQAGGGAAVTPQYHHALMLMNPLYTIPFEQTGWIHTASACCG
jgi:hypothetical protein